LGRGFLAGQIQRFEALAPDDFRRSSPRFQGENFGEYPALDGQHPDTPQNFHKNPVLFDRIKDWRLRGLCPGAARARVDARRKAQISLRCLVQAPRSYLEQNAGALDVRLSADDLRRIEQAAPRGTAVGDQYPAVTMRLLNG
jgi:hypothetical protein